LQSQFRSVGRDLDIQARVIDFIGRLTTGTFQAQADVNEDGVVNLLDVDPFIDLLAGG
jgi:hypothetical protein